MMTEATLTAVKAVTVVMECVAMTNCVAMVAVFNEYVWVEDVCDVSVVCNGECDN